MKKPKLIFTTLLFAGLGLAGAKGQASLNAAGGNATGPGGSASYSVGQIAYTTISGNGGSAIQGVQLPFEIFPVSNQELESISLSLTAYPNPTENELLLKTDHQKWAELSYQLFDVQGKVLQEKAFAATENKISIQNQPIGAYFLKINKGLAEVKTFKILKNQ